MPSYAYMFKDQVLDLRMGTRTTNPGIMATSSSAKNFALKD